MPAVAEGVMRGSAAAGWLDHRGADAGERMSEKIDYEGLKKLLDDGAQLVEVLPRGDTTS